MKSEVIGRWWIAITTAVVVVAFIAFWAALGWEGRALLASATLGIIIATFSAFLWVYRGKIQDKKAGFPFKDERTKYIEGRAAHYAVMISAWFMVGLIWYNFLGVDFGLPELKVIPALAASILVMVGLYIGLRWYFSRKENIR